MSQAHRFPRWAVFFFLLGLPLVGAVLFYAIWTQQRVADEFAWVRHTYEVAERIHAIETGGLQLQSGIRGYVITAEKRYLEQFESGERLVRESTESLKKLVRDRPPQLVRLLALEELMQQRIGMARESIGERGPVRWKPDVLRRRSAVGARLNGEIRSRLKEMLEEERSLLSQRVSAAEDSSNRIARVAVVGGTIALLFLALAAALLRRDFRMRTLATEALAASERKFKNAFDNAPIGVGLLSLRGQWLEVNATMAQMYGFRREELVGQAYEAHLLAEDVPASRQLAEKLVSGEIEGLELERRYVRRDGSVFWAILHLTAQRDAAGKPESFLIEVKDITVLKEREQTLAEAARLKGEFVANISHEIRTPLNGIIATADLLANSGLSADQSHYARIIRTAGRSLSTIVADILDFSKIEAGKMQLECEPFALRPLLADQVALLERTAGEKGVALELSVSPELAPAFVGDAGRIGQVLVNLVGNALKFTERGGVSVRVLPERAPGGAQGNGKEKVRLRFEVHDTGIGITPEQKARLFRPFSQADGSTSRRFGGTGLGLSISKRLVELMGGEIGVESDGRNGSCFWFRVELEVARVDAGASDFSEAGRSDRPTWSRPMCVLVAEDNPVNQMIIRKTLESLGVGAQIVANGREALDALGNRRFDAILMDCQMPEMDGYEATRTLRRSERPEDRRIPVIALTANANGGDEERCLGVGMDDYLSKPIRRERLAEKLEKWLDAGRRRRENPT